MSCSRTEEQGWRSGERARLPPMCPRFDSQTRRHMWVEFVVGSRPCSEGFSPGSPVFLPPQKSTFLNSNSIGNLRATGLSVSYDCYVLPSLHKVDFNTTQCLPPELEPTWLDQETSALTTRPPYMPMYIPILLSDSL